MKDKTRATGMWEKEEKAYEKLEFICMWKKGEKAKKFNDQFHVWITHRTGKYCRCFFLVVLARNWCALDALPNGYKCIRWNVWNRIRNFRITNKINLKVTKQKKECFANISRDFYLICYTQWLLRCNLWKGRYLLVKNIHFNALIYYSAYTNNSLFLLN